MVQAHLDPTTSRSCAYLLPSPEELSPLLPRTRPGREHGSHPTGWSWRLSLHRLILTLVNSTTPLVDVDPLTSRCKKGTVPHYEITGIQYPPADQLRTKLIAEVLVDLPRLADSHESPIL